MNFSSLPSYFDSPPHWQQQPNHQLGITTSTGVPNDNHQQIPPPPPPPPQSSTGMIRPNSMTDRARLAKIQQPESAMKCPRCDSSNTKFCYFNNYSLTQPRHFCKTCRRYWTRGGTLRNVPVGGGCRRNKRSKGSSSKSPSSSSAAPRGGGGGGRGSSSTTSSTNTTTSLPSNSYSSDIRTSQMLPQSSFIDPIQQLQQDYSYQMAAGFHGFRPPMVVANMGGIDMDFQQGSRTTTTAVGCAGAGAGGGSGSVADGAGGTCFYDHWRALQQFPFLGGGGAYPFEGDLSGTATYPKAQVKMEENYQGLSLPRQFLGIHGNDQYWGTGGASGSNGGAGNAWTDLSGFSSSTATHHHCL